MTDEQGAAGDEAGAVELAPSQDDLLPVAGLPGLASRIEGVHGSLSTLGMRIDALVTSTTSYRSSLTDRLAEYSDLVARLTRQQASDLEEYRRVSERATQDLRRSLAASEQLLENVSSRLDDMAAEAGSTDDQTRRLVGEVRAILDAQEALGRFLTEALDQFGERVLERVGAVQDDVAQGIAGLGATLQSLRDAAPPTPPDVATVGHLDALRDGLLEGLRQVEAALVGGEDVRLQEAIELLERVHDEVVSSNEVTARHSGEFAVLRTQLESVAAAIEARPRPDADPALLERLDGLTDGLADVASGQVVGALWEELRTIRSRVEAVAGGEDDDASAHVLELESLAADVAALRAELGRGLVVEPSEALAGAVDELRDDVSGLRQGLAALGDLDGRFGALQLDLTRLLEGQAAMAPPPPPPPPPADVDAMRDDLATLRGELEAVAGIDAKIAALATDVAPVREVEAQVHRIVDRLAPLDALASGLGSVAAGVDRLLAVVEPGEDAATAAGLDEQVDQLDEVRRELAALRFDLGGIVTPQQLQGELAPVRDVEARLEALSVALAAVATQLGEVRTLAAAGAEAAATADPGEPTDDAGSAAELLAELRALREGIDGLRVDVDDLGAQLRVLATEPPPTAMPAPPPPPPAPVAPEVAADVAVEVTAGLSAELHAGLGGVNEVLESLRVEVAGLRDQLREALAEVEEPEPVRTPAEVDRAAAIAAPAQVDGLGEALEQVQRELVSLRRRITLRLGQDVLAPEQLDAIAEALASRLAPAGKAAKAAKATTSRARPASK